MKNRTGLHGEALRECPPLREGELPLDRFFPDIGSATLRRPSPPGSRDAQAGSG